MTQQQPPDSPGFLHRFFRARRRGRLLILAIVIAVALFGTLTPKPTPSTPSSASSTPSPLQLTAFPPTDTLTLEPTRQSRPSEDDERGWDDHDAEMEYYDNIASTAQAEHYKELAEDALKQATRDAAFYEPNCIHWSQAYAYIGHATCVYGDVTHTHDSGRAFFINFSPDHTAFYAVSFDWLWEDLEGECVTIHGTIETYEGRPQIIIHTLDQLQYCQ